ncbi:hypothetical protein [Streptomyces sp. NPDC088752]|uniref:hypothetical protein n=1 Tax=Streptomyces sp. NPDC088752 TaxID=3154963 RepID=UPI003423BBF9
MSARCLYWLARIEDSTWRPNRHFWNQGYDGRSTWLGTWLWEAQNIISPLLANLESGVGLQCARALGHNLNDCCGSCHGQYEYEGTYMCDGYDWKGRGLHTCCQASITSSNNLHLVPWSVRCGVLA